MLKYKIEQKIFDFKIPSGTSRGVLSKKKAWYIKLWDDVSPNVFGTGECSIIEGLSPDFDNDFDYEVNLVYFVENLLKTINLKNSFLEFTQILPELKEYPSILFGLETAFLDLINGGKGLIFDSDFTQNKKNIPINGLIWMGKEDFIQEQIEEKIEHGFSCIKMKISAENFEKEHEILKKLRKRFPVNELIIRVDANGAFSEENAISYLDKLAELDLHSIEQPIKAGNHDQMRSLCTQTKIPIALDEELIGICEKESKIRLLDSINPQYIILKPSLHGGIVGTTEWIELVQHRNIPWWMTSALESNVGLNAISQFVATFEVKMHQGLGTGSLYVENSSSYSEIVNGKMYFKQP